MHLLVQTATNVPPFVGPSIDEFFPPIFLFQSTPFEVNRIMLVRFVAVAALVIVFWLGTRRLRV
ncbi:MAG: F0F1 ATP synthase subunit A, partial [Microbacteriaceae bacterium]